MDCPTPVAEPATSLTVGIDGAFVKAKPEEGNGATVCSRFWEICGTGNCERTLNAGGSLAHTLQPEVPILSVLCNERVYPLPLSLTRIARPWAYLNTTSSRVHFECGQTLRIAS